MMFAPILRRVIPSVMALYGYRQLRLLRSENTRLRHDPSPACRPGPRGPPTRCGRCPGCGSRLSCCAT